LDIIFLASIAEYLTCRYPRCNCKRSSINRKNMYTCAYY